MSRLAVILPLVLAGCITVLPPPVPLGSPPSALQPASAACPVPARSAAKAAALLALINAERARAGLGPLSLSAPLSAAAHAHACDNAARQTTSHQGSDGSTLADRLTRHGIGYRLAAENTGLGFASAETAMQAWMSSAPHRANILTQGITLIGVGLADGSPRDTWVLAVIQPQ